MLQRPSRSCECMVKAVAKRDIGRILREQRRRRGWTLEKMSQNTGLGVSHLSKMENNKTGLSFDALVRVAEVLGVPFEALFNPSGDAIATGRRVITRRGDAARFSTPQYDYDMHGAELLTKRMIPLVMTVKVRDPDDTPNLSRHPGEEYVYVISGQIRVITDQYADVSLAANESIYFDSGMGHAFVSEGDESALILSVCWTYGPYTINEDRNGHPILMEDTLVLSRFGAAPLIA